MTDSTKNPRALLRLKANIPCIAQILAPEETFSPYQCEGTILDISRAGIGLAVPEMPQSVYSTLLRDRPYTRIITELPGIRSETRIFGRTVWVDRRLGENGFLCCLGVSIGKNPPEVLSQLEHALQVLAQE